MERTIQVNGGEPVSKGAGRLRKRVKKALRNWELYALISPVLVFFILFEYFPMYGVQIAFKDFIATKGIWGSPWAGLKHFERFMQGFYFNRLMINTIAISLYHLALSFPLAIFLALMMNEVRHSLLRRTVQTITYAPHFISVVVLVGMMTVFLSPQTGLVNQFLGLMGVPRVDFMAEAAWFKSLYVLSGVWQNTGWSSIIFIAALAGVDPQQHESAMLDGASRWQRIWHVNIPGIMPTIIILLILECGKIMTVGFEKAFLMQNDMNIAASDVIATHVYRSGILGAQYSFAAAVGLFNAVINLVLLLTVNRISRKVTATSLW
ncbi:ABC transporter permease subunit [Paenibacillus sp. J5C_2022]|uniref:ABC transporter permease n=1 Tax=Paenibacillus sp. J5C2022 TaxID=2977129 RepID=UPI0021CEEDF4|nr:ABC transporter permease subunit [Paenibacillus sp. J5C2022]MCU6709950.1 ABC transporter permease subunit [Paenibacillus sp. J5C2022]